MGQKKRRYIVTSTTRHQKEFEKVDESLTLDCASIVVVFSRDSIKNGTFRTISDAPPANMMTRNEKSKADPDFICAPFVQIRHRIGEC